MSIVKVTNKEMNLCDYCSFCMSDCYGEVKFGEGYGNDNIIECDCYNGEIGGEIYEEY